MKWKYGRPIIVAVFITVVCFLLAVLAHKNVPERLFSYILDIVSFVSALVTIVMIIAHWANIYEADRQDLEDLRNKKSEVAKKFIMSSIKDLENNIKKDDYTFTADFISNILDSINSVINAKRLNTRNSITSECKKEIKSIQEIQTITDRQSAIKIRKALKDLSIYLEIK